MKQATRFAVQPSWKLLIRDMGYSPSEVLALARLPADLFARHQATLTPGEYFDLWRALEQVARGEELALKLGQVISVEAFDPALFACVCSPDLNTALERLAQYKRLIGPMTMGVDIERDTTRVSLTCYGYSSAIPRSLSVAELVFFTQLARLATRERIAPLAASCPDLPTNLAVYEAYLGCGLRASETIQIVFSAEDARRPFLTENVAMWEVFEPSLKKRLSELDDTAKMIDRVRGVLLELLPAGLHSADAVAQRLALSKRSMQRHLADEAVSFKVVLDGVRQDLAQHYLSNTRLSPGEISWLLGFQESHSFGRAFRAWTGRTPAAFRQQARASASPAAHRLS